MDKEKCLIEAHQQLSDERFYKKSDTCDELSAKITETLQKMFDKDEIDGNVLGTLCTNNCSPKQILSTVTCQTVL
jgi:hypothetical protein